MDRRTQMPQGAPPAWEGTGLLLAALLPSGAAWLYFVTFADAALMPAVYVACKLVQFSLPLAWIGAGLLRPRGLLAGTARGAAEGILWGLAMAAVLVGVYAGLVAGTGLAAASAPRVAARIEAIGAATPARYLLLALAISLVHSFLEEFYWRWLLFGRLRGRWSGAAALAASSLAFAGHHVIALHAFIGAGPHGWMTVVLALAVAVGGGLWAWLYARTGSLLAPWLSHVLVDLAIFAIGAHLAWGLVTQGA